MCHAESLFLVDDGKTEIFEFNILLHQSVCTDDDVDFAGFQLLDNFLLLLRRSETGEQFYLDGEALHPFEHCLIVLPRQNCSRTKDGALLRIQHAFKGGAKRYLSFAESDVAAQQSFHRCLTFHIFLDFLYTAELVVCFFIREMRFKIALPV